MQTKVKNWEWKILNIHPSLLPKFPWANAIKDAIQAWEKIIGCTVHFIDKWVDTWEIILQKKVEIFSWENMEEIKKKIQNAEQKIYSKAILKVVNSL